MAYDSARRSDRLRRSRVSAVERDHVDDRLSIAPDFDFGRGREAHDLIGRNVLDQADIAAPQGADRRLTRRQTHLANSLDSWYRQRGLAGRFCRGWGCRHCSRPAQSQLDCFAVGPKTLIGPV